ncbi:MAG: GNAT family N-acetyltransferase [Bacteroidetes bacterium]|nr:GNAT family N-acetyltransferase [Bacteroidota bacterium]
MALAPFKNLSFVCNNRELELCTLHSLHANGLHRFIQSNFNRFIGPFPVTATSLNISLAEARGWVAEKRSQNRENKALQLVCSIPSGEVVAMVSAFNFDWRTPRCEVSYMVDKEWEGTGLASFCLKQLIEHLQSQCGVIKILCRVDPENHRSLRLAESLGFQREGLHRCDFRNGHGRLLDVVYYGLVKE